VTRERVAGRNHDINTNDETFDYLAMFRCLGNDAKKSELHLQGKYQQNKFGECLLHFGLECYIFRLLFWNTKKEIHRTIILPVVVCGRGTCSVSLKELHRLRVLEYKVLKRTLETKEEEVTGDRTKQHNVEIILKCAIPIVCSN